MFQSAFKLVTLKCIKNQWCFGDKVTAMENKFDETPSNPKWNMFTSIPFKKLITQHQDRYPLRHMAKNSMGLSQEGNSSLIPCLIYDT